MSMGGAADSGCGGTAAIWVPVPPPADGCPPPDGCGADGGDGALGLTVMPPDGASGLGDV
jgi:hypothetical protein